MGLFNRDYDRDYGYRGGTRNRGFRAGGYDRDLHGERGGWDRLKRNTREFFGMDNRYDRSFGYDQNYNAFGGGQQRGMERPRQGGMNRGWGNSYDRDVYRGERGGGNWSGKRGDQPHWGYDTWRYDNEHKAREQTDTGDPFGDRESGTPIRVIEDRDRDRGWFGWGSDRDYDREHRRQYGRNPVGYESYDDSQRFGGRGRNLDPGLRRNRDYDRGGF